MIRKADVILIAIILLLSLSLFFLLVPKNSGTTAVIRVNNKEVARLPLNKDAVYELEHNTVRIEKGSVFMKDAHCRDRVCINQGKINKSGQSIICLPNGVIVEVE